MRLGRITVWDEPINKILASLNAGFRQAMVRQRIEEETGIKDLAVSPADIGKGKGWKAARRTECCDKDIAVTIMQGLYEVVQHWELRLTQKLRHTSFRSSCLSVNAPATIFIPTKSLYSSRSETMNADSQEAMRKIARDDVDPRSETGVFPRVYVCLIDELLLCD
jgi:hypothetical protein